MDVLNKLFNLSTAHKQMQKEKECFTHADMLLPNSNKEMEMIKKLFGINTPQKVIPNAVDKEVYSKNKTYSRMNMHNLPKEYLLSVCIISPRKNIL